MQHGGVRYKLYSIPVYAEQSLVTSQCCPRRMAVLRLRVWRADGRTDIHCRLGGGVGHCTVASRRAVCARGAVVRWSDVVLGAACLSSVV